jgi:serpin B
VVPKFGQILTRTTRATRHGQHFFFFFDSPFTDTNGLVVINAVGFKGEWENKFPRENTRAAPFHQLGSGVAVDVQMMRHSSVSVAHGTFEHHSMVSLPHEAGLLRLLVLLPHVNSAEALAAVRRLRVV